MEAVTPEPGSLQAVAQGCTCSTTLNRHGKGTLHGQPRFYYDRKCPVHKIEVEQRAQKAGEIIPPRHDDKTSQPAAEPAIVFADQLYPGDWRVEWIDDDGNVEVAIFAGPRAHERAIRYADRQYGLFKEGSLDP